MHSYLVLRYAEGNRAAVTVGFYYCSNAAGRLLGTLMSGVLYTYPGSSSEDGFGWCFVVSAAFIAACVALTQFIRDDEGRLACGRVMLVKQPLPGEVQAREQEHGAEVRATICRWLQMRCSTVLGHVDGGVHDPTQPTLVPAMLVFKAAHHSSSQRAALLSGMNTWTSCS